MHTNFVGPSCLYLKVDHSHIARRSNCKRRHNALDFSSAWFPHHGQFLQLRKMKSREYFDKCVRMPKIAEGEPSIQGKSKCPTSSAETCWNFIHHEGLQMRGNRCKGAYGIGASASEGEMTDVGTKPELDNTRQLIDDSYTPGFLTELMAVAWLRTVTGRALESRGHDKFAGRYERGRIFNFGLRVCSAKAGAFFAIGGRFRFLDKWGLVTVRHYESVLTTRNGLWRYRLGDVVSVKGFDPEDGMPIINYLHRELKSQLTNAIVSTANRWIGQITNFTIVSDEREQTFEDLMAANPEYRLAFWQAGSRKPTIRLVEKGAFSEYRRQKSEKLDVLAAPVKVPVIISDPTYKEWLLKRVIMEL
ncbi:hypothetical protein DFH29DRAFT_877320 [Suillus ampliporus]|nr:hypothetical protein DFH29DRAFT_877320 [Suillus ampliporus]